MSFITSSELDNIAGSEYLHIYLDPKYSFIAKINNEEVDQNEIFIKAPTMSSKDIFDVRRVSTVISKFEETQNEKLSKELARLTEEERARLFSSLKEIESSQEAPAKSQDFIKDHLKTIIKSSRSFEAEKESFFSEFDKITHFLETRTMRSLDSDLLPLNFSIFDKHLGLKQFIIEAIFVEYVSFFSKHFPLESFQ